MAKHNQNKPGNNQNQYAEPRPQRLARQLAALRINGIRADEIRSNNQQQRELRVAARRHIGQLIVELPANDPRRAELRDILRRLSPPQPENVHRFFNNLHARAIASERPDHMQFAAELNAEHITPEHIQALMGGAPPRSELEQVLQFEIAQIHQPIVEQPPHPAYENSSSSSSCSS
ncbi:hypothetical protein ACFORL_07540 [Legionella dresdenensis]|uniref:Uncharacterized protein n=1 Tax=Legionella dresdenensis TaxID=450200 RepID=A0ABV8CFF6_9GAMM